MSFDKFNFRIVYFNIILIKDNFKKCTNRSSISFKEFYVEIEFAAIFASSCWQAWRKNSLTAENHLPDVLIQKLKTLFHI